MHRRGLVDDGPTGIAIGPDAAGIDEWLVAAGEGVEDGVDRGAVDGCIVRRGQVDDGVGRAGGGRSGTLAYAVSPAAG
jgi:hypothetical protein